MNALGEGRAIKLTLQMWRELEKTGDYKCTSPTLEKHLPVRSGCFLCEYVHQHSDGDCAICPWYKFFKYNCDSWKSPYSHWDCAVQEDLKKEYAHKCVEALEQVLEAFTNGQLS